MEWLSAGAGYVTLCHTRQISFILDPEIARKNTMKKIVWFRQNYLPLEIVQTIKDHVPVFDYTVYENTLGLCYANGFWSRSQSPTTLFLNDPVFFGAEMPRYNASAETDFDRITDARCQWLRKHRWDRPWLLEWSGGLDSTLMICAVLKNLETQDLDNITVGMTRASLYENSQFYHDVIEHKFKILDLNSPHYSNIYHTHYLVNGEPADMLPGGGLAEYARRCGIDLSLPWRDNIGLLRTFLSNTRIGITGTDFLLKTMQDELGNLDPGAPPVDIIAEWFWWINFCWKWMSLTVHRLHPGRQDAKRYIEALVNWFDTQEYQQWSMLRGRYSLLTNASTPKSYKQDWRRYIHQIWSDAHFNHFKIKIASTSLALDASAPWACLLDDYSFLSFPKDQDQIKKLLPYVINDHFKKQTP